MHVNFSRKFLKQFALILKIEYSNIEKKIECVSYVISGADTKIAYLRQVLF